MEKDRSSREEGAADAGKTRSKKRQDTDEANVEEQADKRSRPAGTGSRPPAQTLGNEQSEGDQSEEEDNAQNAAGGAQKRRAASEDNTFESLKRRLTAAQSQTSSIKAQAESLRLRLDEERRQRATDQMYYTRQLQMQDQRYRELWAQYEKAYAMAKQPGVPRFSFDMIARTDRDIQNYTGFRNAEALKHFREYCLARGVKDEYEAMPAVRHDPKQPKNPDDPDEEQDAGSVLPAIAQAPVPAGDAVTAPAPAPAPAPLPTNTPGGQDLAGTGEAGEDGAGAGTPKRKDGAKKFGRPPTVNFDDALMILLVRNKHNTPYFLLGHLFGTSPNTAHRVYLRIKASLDKRYPDAKLPQKKSTNLSVTQT